MPAIAAQYEYMHCGVLIIPLLFRIFTMRPIIVFGKIFQIITSEPGNNAFWWLDSKLGDTPPWLT